MNKSLKAAAAAAMGIGFMFAVPTVVVNAGPCCTPGGLNPAAYQACLAGEALGGTCSAQVPQAAQPAPSLTTHVLPPMMEPQPPG
jgi:hypothetical protein